MQFHKASVIQNGFFYLYLKNEQEVLHMSIKMDKKTFYLIFQKPLTATVTNVLLQKSMHIVFHFLHKDLKAIIYLILIKEQKPRKYDDLFCNHSYVSLSFLVIINNKTCDTSCADGNAPYVIQ